MTEAVLKTVAGRHAENVGRAEEGQIFILDFESFTF